MITPMSLLCSLRSKQKKKKTIYFSIDKKSKRLSLKLNKKFMILVVMNTHVHTLLDVDGL